MTMPTFFVPHSVVRFVYPSNPNPYPNSALNVSLSILFIFFRFFRSLLLLLCFCRRFCCCSFIVYIYFKCVIRRALWARSLRLAARGSFQSLASKSKKQSGELRVFQSCAPKAPILSPASPALPSCFCYILMSLIARVNK